MPFFDFFCVSKLIATAHAHKSGVIFHFFLRPFKQKKVKALRPKMTKIASSWGPALRVASNVHTSILNSTTSVMQREVLVQFVCKNVVFRINVRTLQNHKL